MKSRIVRILSSDGFARLFVAQTTGIVQKAHEIHHTSKTMTAALGRALTGCSLMGTLLKDKGDSLTLRFKGDGAAGTVCCVSDYQGNVRGYADHPEAELPPNSIGKLDVGGAIGHNGTLYVIKDMGMSEPYCGISDLVSGEVAEDITDYFSRSEQTPTVCALGVRCDTECNCTSAGGFLLQLLPGIEASYIDHLEENVRKITSVSAMAANADFPRMLADTVFTGIGYDIFDEFPIGYQCNCSAERYRKALLGLNQTDFDELIAEGKPIETRCRFCGKAYAFSTEELKDAYGEPETEA